jgi:protein gp37
MATQTAIEWTDTTWNPVSGCTKVGRGCDHCYAERIAERFRGTPGHPFERGFDLTLRPHKLNEPLAWRRPRRVFVNSMSDLFHKDIPRAFLNQVFDTMEQAHWHQFQVLTKRSSLLRNFLNARYASVRPPEHIWFGVSIEDKSVVSRIKHLQQASAAVRFVSFEPLLEDLGDINLDGIQWAIAGGESGPKSRGMEVEWVRSLRDQCRSAGVAFFFKQWGGNTPKAGGNTLDGRRWQQYPRSLRPAVQRQSARE